MSSGRSRQLDEVSFSVDLGTGEVEPLAEMTLESAGLRTTLTTPGKRALYNNLGQDEDLALAIDDTVKEKRPDAWERIPAEREPHQSSPLLGNDKAEVERIFAIIKEQPEY